MVKRIICVIPARLRSSRLPQKLLIEVAGKPLIQWVYEKACACPLFNEVHIAIDDPKMAQVLDRLGASYAMTDPQCPSGTARMLDFRKRTGLSADIWVNWQGDEPLISADMLQDLTRGMLTTHHEHFIGTLKQPLLEGALTEPNTVKVVTDEEGRALLFTRQTQQQAFAHIGLYAFTHATCDLIETLSPSEQVQAHSLEQLQFLEHGIPIQTYTVSDRCIGIDTQEDLLAVQQLLRVTKR